MPDPDHPDPDHPDPGCAAPDPASRVRTPLPELVAHVSREYRFGDDYSWSVLATGYEDCNVRMDLGAFGIVVKVFATGRPPGIAERTADLITRVRAAGVRHPRLHPDSAGRLVHTYDGHQLIVMDLAPGRTFYELGRPPAGAEVRAVVEQAARIHSVDARPEPVFDWWALENMVPLAREVDSLLSAEQRALVEAVISDMSALDWSELPEALIHADLTAGNVLLGDGSPTGQASGQVSGSAGEQASGQASGEIGVLDFALANRWPRLQELAVIAASLLHGSPEPVAERMTEVASLYSSVADTPLTGAEWDALHVFGRAAAAMELLGGLGQWQQGNQGEETAQLIEIGDTSLREYDATA